MNADAVRAKCERVIAWAEKRKTPDQTGIMLDARVVLELLAAPQQPEER